jgi:PAS domain S-box-containing protein
MTRKRSSESGLDHHQDQLKRLAESSVRIASADTPEATLQAIADQARVLIGAHLAATHRGSRRERNVATSVSEKYLQFKSFAVPPNGSGIYRQVVERRQPLRLSHSELLAHPAWLDFSGYDSEHPPLRGLLAVPLAGKGGEAIGVIMLSDKERGEFTSEDEAVLVQLAQIASVSIENALATQALQESEQRLKATQEHANIGIGEVNAEGKFVSVNSGLVAISGYEREELLNASFFDVTHPEDVAAEREIYARHVAGELPNYSLEKRYVRKDGSAAWIALSASAVFSPSGRFLYSVRIVQDISERKSTEERQQLLIRELHHRVRNTLATVQALLGATARSAKSIKEFYDAFAARIASLGKTHTLLTNDYWQTAPLREMLKNELAPFDDGKGRIKLEGPPIELTSELAVPTGMAIYELTSNAVRHGALSVPCGRVAVTWDIVREEGVRKLDLRWMEAEGPPVVEPSQKGFGSTLLQRILTMQCDATVEAEYKSDGFRFRMIAPLVERRLVPTY